MLEATLKPLCPPYVFSRRQFQLQLQVVFLLRHLASGMSKARQRNNSSAKNAAYKGKWNVKSATAQQFKREKRGIQNSKLGLSADPQDLTANQSPAILQLQLSAALRMAPGCPQWQE